MVARMSEAAVGRAARVLLAARRDRRVIEGLPEACAPSSLADAYRVQARLFELMERPRCGWFVGCSNPEIQRQLGLPEPYRAPLLADTIFESPACLEPELYPSITLEVEFAFCLSRDLPPREAAYAGEEIAEAVETLHPAIEVVSSHLADWTRQPIFSLIADNGTDGALVIGPGKSDWRGLDLAEVEVVLEVNDRTERRGRGANVLGDPFNAFVWLANACSGAGVALKAGHLHNTGSCTAMVHVSAGDRARASFSGLGDVEVTFAA